MSAESLKSYRLFLEKNVYPWQQTEAPSGSLVSHIVKCYLVWAERTYPIGSRSEFSNMRVASAHLLAAHGELEAAEFGPKKLKEVQHRLAKAKKTRGYVNAVTARIKRIFRWAVSEELLAPSVWHGLQSVSGLRRDRTPALESVPRETVQWEWIGAAILELSPAVAAMLHVHWLTGVRSQSLCAARAGQFDTNQNPWVWRPKHKTESMGHELEVFIGPQAQGILNPLLKGKRPEDYLFSPTNVGGGRSRGYRSFYDSVSYLRAVARAQYRVNSARAEAGLKPFPKWVPHQLRHTRGTLVRNAYGLEAAQASLGHKRMDATQIYAKRLRDMAQKVAEETG